MSHWSSTIGREAQICDDGVLNTSEAGEETGAELGLGLSVKYKRTLCLC